MRRARLAAATAAILSRLAEAARATRLVVGAPDYEGYLRHVRERHPGAATLSREEFADARLRARYERPGSRCC